MHLFSRKDTKTGKSTYGDRARARGWQLNIIHNRFTGNRIMVAICCAKLDTVFASTGSANNSVKFAVRSQLMHAVVKSDDISRMTLPSPLARLW
jgi:hypothetical protein